MLEFSAPLAKVLAGYSLSSSQGKLELDTYIVTPRRRLARQIKEVANNTMQDKLSYTPKIMTIGDWLIRQAEGLLAKEQILLMGSLQAQLIWDEALTKIKTSVKLEELSQWDIGDSAMKQKLIAQAQDAWRKIHLYQLDISDKAFAKESITNFFSQWANAYRNICQERSLCDEFMLTTKLFSAIMAKDLNISPSLWVGFTDTYPLYERLYELIAKQDAGLVAKADAFKILPEVSNSTQGEMTIGEYDNDKDELVALAEKVRAFATDNPDSDIGVVIPGLEQNWHKVRQVFARCLQGDGSNVSNDSACSAEDALDDKDIQSAMSWDMSWGEELQEFPLIGSVLDLLQLSPQRVPPSHLLDRFNSPYLTGHKKEAVARRRLDSKLCMMSTAYKEISLSDIVAKDPLPTAKSTSATNLLAEVPILRGCLDEYFRVEGAFVKSANPRQWAKVLAEQIYALGWGDIGWSHLERQLWDKLQGLLDGLQAAGNITDEMTREEALAFMKLQASQIFQPSPAPSKIKLLGISEVAGLGFSKLFAVRMDSTCIPQEKVNFFIPFALANLAKLIGRDSHREKEQAILGDLRRAAPAVTLSYAKVVGDEDRLPHPLLNHLRRAAAAPKILEKEDKQVKDSMELLYDVKVAQVGDAEKLSNLVGIIKDHASCPFQSFMAHRVAPNKLKDSQEEISQMERGTLLHKILRDLWDRLKDKESLDKLIAADLEAFKKKLATSVTKALDEQRGVFLRDDMTYELEEQLLIKLTESLVFFENNRGKNFRIVAAEKKDQVIMGSRKFDVKIDRIDLVTGEDENAADSSSHILIDYKLSNRKFIGKYMRGERPEEPQLIIYSLVGDENKFRSLGFITLQPKEKDTPIADGLGIEEDGLFYDSKDSITEEELGEMQMNVKRIYENFTAGLSQVDPRNNDACSRCDYSAVCRVGEILDNTNAEKKRGQASV